MAGVTKKFLFLYFFGAVNTLMVYICDLIDKMFLIFSYIITVKNSKSTGDDGIKFFIHTRVAAKQHLPSSAHVPSPHED